MDRRHYAYTIASPQRITPARMSLSSFMNDYLELLADKMYLKKQEF
jgi:hypothetical protein